MVRKTKNHSPSRWYQAQLAKINDSLSKREEGAIKVREGAISLLGGVKERVDELSQGSTFITATLNPLPSDSDQYEAQRNGTGLSQDGYFIGLAFQHLDTIHR
jgi:hypothetical protein